MHGQAGRLAHAQWISTAVRYQATTRAVIIDYSLAQFTSLVRVSIGVQRVFIVQLLSAIRPVMVVVQFMLYNRI